MPSHLAISRLRSGVENVTQEEFQSKPVQHTMIIDADDKRSVEIRRDFNWTPAQAPVSGQLVENMKFRNSKVNWTITLW